MPRLKNTIKKDSPHAPVTEATCNKAGCCQRVEERVFHCTPSISSRAHSSRTQAPANAHTPKIRIMKDLSRILGMILCNRSSQIQIPQQNIKEQPAQHVRPMCNPPKCSPRWISHGILENQQKKEVTKAANAKRPIRGRNIAQAMNGQKQTKAEANWLKGAKEIVYRETVSVIHIKGTSHCFHRTLSLGLGSSLVLPSPIHQPFSLLA